MTQNQVTLHFWTTQVKITIFQADVFIYIDIILNVEWRCFRRIQYAKFFTIHFISACRQVRIDCFFIAFCNFTTYTKHIFITNIFSLVERFHIMIWGCYNLNDARTISQVQEDQTAVVTTTFNPTT